LNDYFPFSIFRFSFSILSRVARNQMKNEKWQTENGK